MKVTILWGLPGSGKTHYAEEWKKTPNRTVISVDKIKRIKGKKDFLIDGLITTNKVAREIIESIPDAVFEIVYWKPDREACKHNDRGRRTLNSTLTIDNLPFEEPNKKLLKDFNISLVKKDVVRKPEYKAFAEENDIELYKGKFIKSQRWCLGGTHCSYSGYQNTLEAEKPAEFDEFDELLEKMDPNITFLKYKKLMKETVTIEEFEEGDYYGGSVKYAYYVCDLEKLYELL